jgi:dTDP-4-dehydrorhamnose reductase
MIDVLITGGGGMLAYALRQEFERRDYRVEAPTRSQLDVTNENDVHDLVRRIEPRVVIQCAAFTRVDDAESHEDEAYRVNVLGTEFVAEAAHHVGARFVFPSTDYVFDGIATRPYQPGDEANPISAYGRSKLAGEQAARRAPNHLIVRMSWLYGPGGRNFVRTVADRLDRGDPLRVVNDQFGRPSWTLDAALGIVGLLTAKVNAGVFHWANEGSASWHEVAEEIARQRGKSAVAACETSEYPTAAVRPRYSVLDTKQTDNVIGRSREWRIALSEALARAAF